MMIRARVGVPTLALLTAALHGWATMGVAHAAEARPPDAVQTNAAASESVSAPVSAPALHPLDNARLLSYSLEELLASEVTSVGKKPQRPADSAAAVYVISQEDIARSSARQVSDLLRMVPGLDVVSATSSITSVSARGFDSTYGVGMLVMIDGAAVYSSSVAGMFWDQALVPLQDIERIEVIRGPGGPLWGSNSTSGIINIITRQAVDTQGLRVVAKVGATTQRVEVGYGRQVGDALSLRAYGTYLYDRGLAGAAGQAYRDAHRSGLLGLRLDAAPGGNDALVGVIEASRSDYDEAVLAMVPGPTGYATTVGSEANAFTTLHALARWRHRSSDRFDLSLQAYANRFARSLWGSHIARDLGDLSAEGRWQANPAHDINFGLEARISHDTLTAGPIFFLPGGASTDRWLSGYLQDDIRLSGDALRLTIGTKAEVNNFVGLLAQPSVRLFWRPDRRLAMWGAVTHALRTPQLRERGLEFHLPSLQSLPGSPGPVPVLIDLKGNGAAVSERLTAYEAGLRLGLSARWMLDAAGFYNAYSRLNTANTLSVEPLFLPGGATPAGMIYHATIGAQASGRSFGGEVMLKGHPTDRWTTELSWSYIDLRLSVPAAIAATALSMQDDGAPARNQVRWRNALDLSDRFSASSLLHYVGPSQDRRRAAYTDLDMRVDWHSRGAVDVSLVGENLIRPRHVEFFQTVLPVPVVAVPRRIYVEARVRF